MTATTRGVNREEIFYIQVTSKILYGFKPIDITSITGVSATDTTALGWLDASTAAAASGKIRVFTPKSPTPARYRKLLNRRPAAGQRGSVSAYGNPDPDNGERKALVTAGWTKIKDGSTIKIQSNEKRETVGVPLENGLIYVVNVDTPMAVAYASELGLLRATDLRSGSDILSCFYGTTRPNPAKVRRVEGEGTLTMPCDDANAVGLQASGDWVIVHREKTSLLDPDSPTVAP